MWSPVVAGGGIGAPLLTTLACDPPSGYVGNAADCDDGDPACWEGACCLGQQLDCAGVLDCALGCQMDYACMDACIRQGTPEAQQLATYIGWLLHRLPGGVVAGAGSGDSRA